MKLQIELEASEVELRDLFKVLCSSLMTYHEALDATDAPKVLATSLACEIITQIHKALKLPDNPKVPEMRERREDLRRCIARQDN